MMMYQVTPLLIATTNPAKLEKLKWAVERMPVEPVALSDRPDIKLPDEAGKTFRENATSKAVEASMQFDGLVIASDGGVRIPSLGAAWDELYTGRAAGVGASDAEKAQHLLKLMEGKTGEERRVYWSEAVALAYNGEKVADFEAEGTDGYLTETYDPSNAIPGFWVYSLWLFPSLEKRYVDATPEELAELDMTWNLQKAMLESWSRDSLISY